MSTETERINRILSIANEGFWEWNLQTDQIYLSPQFYKLTGYAPDHTVCNSDFLKLIIHPDDHQKFFQAMHEPDHGQTEPSILEYRIIAKDGSMHWIESRSHLFEHNDDERVLLISGTINDITERKKSENEVLRLSRVLQAIYSCNQILIDAHDEMELLNEICRIVVETGSYQMAWVGYAEHDKAKSVQPVAQAGFEDGYLKTLNISWADVERGKGPAGTAIRTGQPSFIGNINSDPRYKLWRNEAIDRGYASKQSIPLKTNETVFGSLNIYSAYPEAFNTEEKTLLTSLADNLAYGITMLRMRQAKELAVEELQHSEAQYKCLFQNKHTVMLILNHENGQIIDANPAAVSYYGWSHDELCQMNINQINLLTDQQIKAEMQLAHEEKRAHFLFRHCRADGSIRDVEVVGGALTIRNKSLIYAIVHDITERKEFEESLLESNERMHLILTATNAALWEYEIATNTSIWSDEAWRLLGLSLNSCKPDYENWINSIVPEDRENVEQSVMKALQTSGEFSCRWRVHDADGKERWLLSKGTPFRDSEGNIAKYVGILVDVTDQKQSEEALYESENRFRMLFEKHSSVMLMVNPETGAITDANNAAASFYGWPVETLKQMSIQQISLSTSADVMNEMDKFRTAEQNSSSYRHRLADGSIRDVEVFSCALSFYGKQMLYSIVHDITERKLAEKALRSSESRFRSITEQMAEMVFVTNSEGTLTYISPCVELLLDYHPHEIIGHSFSEYLAEDERARAFELFYNTIQHRLSTQVIEFRFCKKNGEIFYCEVHFQYYEDSESGGMIGLIQDISTRKREEGIQQKYESELKESQQFLSSIYYEVNHSIFVVDVFPDGMFRFKGINPVHEKLTGIRNDEITGKTPSEFLDSEVAEAVTLNYANCVKEGKAIQYEECLPFNGSNSWWETVLNPVRDESGHIYRIIGTSKNITARKLAEKQLMKMSVAAEQSPAAVLVTDLQGKIEYVNPMFTEHSGYSADEAIGKHPSILKSGLMPNEVYEELWQTILAGRIWRGELQNRKKDGTLYWESVVISAILNHDGVITNFVGVKEDITEQKKMLDELIAAKEKAEESDRLKSAFLANISHEIRTPMNGILGFAELLQEPHLTGEEQAEYIALINQSGQRMLNLINALIDISRIEAEETKLKPAKTPINKLLQDLCLFFKSDAERKGLRLTCTTGLPDEKSIIETDNVKLNQILTNLIQNALKFTVEGSVDIGYTKKDGMLEFYVSDSGIGIPANMTEKIFERFRQVDNSTTRNHEGAGLGLSISKGFVHLLGGTIRVESVEGDGCTFFFTLPYTLSGSPQVAAPAIDCSSRSVPDVTILVAEDDELSALLLGKGLKGEKTTIHYAQNGEEAVEMVKRFPEIRLVLMDIKMPKMNGFEATRQIKQLRPDLPVIAQTAFASSDDTEKAKEAGCDSVITKPINIKNLLEQMRLLLHS
jgi:PAS domain S-box-containing protein